MSRSSTAMSYITQTPRSGKRTLAREAGRARASSGNSVFLSRAINAVVRLQENLSEKSMDEASRASTDYMVLVNALIAAPVSFDLETEDPLWAAKLRGREQLKQLEMAGGGVASSEQAATLLGITRQAVDKRRSQNQLIGLTQGRRGYSYPRFQFVGSSTLRGLEDVLKVLGAGDPWMQLAFFVNPNDRLNGRTPEKELLEGKVDAVLRAARMVGEQGAA
jgi:hypothetical protein